jgi:hypothetical protein
LFDEFVRDRVLVLGLEEVGCWFEEGSLMDVVKCYTFGEAVEIF